MGNIRGNIYSQKHLKFNPKDKEFWNFSFDEFSNFDLPNTIDYILNTTKYNQLSYIGHRLLFIINYDYYL